MCTVCIYKAIKIKKLKNSNYTIHISNTISVYMVDVDGRCLNIHTAQINASFPNKMQCKIK